MRPRIGGEGEGGREGQGRAGQRAVRESRGTE